MGKDKKPRKGDRPEGWSGNSRSHYRPFPGHPSGTTLMRIAFTREAFADLNHHARATLETEVGGVLVGQFCYDDNGDYLETRGVIPAEDTRQGASHVTFTHESWEKIHQSLERDFKGMDIVGWYHTHPGFGVEFSDMDGFIHSNFFSPAQVALVMDPIAGDTACWATIDGRQRYLDRIWVDAREVMLKVPGSRKDPDAEASGEVPQAMVERLEDLESAVSRLMHSLDQFRNVAYRFVFGTVMIIATLAVAAILYTVLTRQTERPEPPKVLQWIPVAVQVGDEEVYLGVSVNTWKIPDSLKSAHREVLQEQLEEFRKEFQKYQESLPGPESSQGGTVEPPEGEADQKDE